MAATGASHDTDLYTQDELSPAELADAIVDAVAQLSPGQRRQLQRRLHANGLFVPETLLTDQQRLTAATALGEQFLRQRIEDSRPLSVGPTPPVRAGSKSSFVQPTAPDARSNSPKRTAKNAGQPDTTASFLSSIPPATIAPAPVERRPYNLTGNQPKPDHSAPYRSPISGKIVVGSPAATDTGTPDPHLMPPLPGQAPERPLILVIERGSYMLRWPGEAPQRVRLTFKAHVTEQEAYYDTLIGVLETVEQRLYDLEANPKTALLDLRSADRLFVQQMRGEIPCEDIMLQVRRNHALKLLKHFAEWRLVHQS